MPDRGGYFDLDEVIAAWKSLGPDSDSADKAFNDLVYYFQKRRERGLDVIENLAAEVCELARWVRMPNKLVRDKSGRSIGTQKVPGLGKLH